MNDGICYPPVKTGKPSADQHIRYVKYVPVGYADTHSMTIGYLLWFVGFTGAHRFYFGRPFTGLLWFLTFGLFGIGWLVDLFLIPSMDRDADTRFRSGTVDFNLAWILFVFLGWTGVHRFYQAKIFTGLAYLLTGGLFGIGLVYDAFTLNEQVSDSNIRKQAAWL
ncbi:MAG: TM2 domain-containing membrane protein YozV [Mariniblastus sp.]|jgi:TM2 domain-containing membrane protein YozV